MSGIVGGSNNRGSGLIADLGTDGQILTSAGLGLRQVFEAAAAGFQTAFASASYNTATASGTVDFTGAGFNPKSAMLWSACDNDGKMTISGGDGGAAYVGQGMITSISNTTAGDFQRTGLGWYAHHSTGNVVTGVLSMITDGIRLTLTKVSSPTGSMEIYVLMFG